MEVMAAERRRGPDRRAYPRSLTVDPPVIIFDEWQTIGAEWVCELLRGRHRKKADFQRGVKLGSPQCAAGHVCLGMEDEWPPRKDAVAIHDVYVRHYYKSKTPFAYEFALGYEMRTLDALACATRAHQMFGINSIQ